MLDIRPLTPAIGAELSGVDLRSELDRPTIAAIRRAWLDHGVIFFRDQALEPEEQLRFARCFGEVQLPVFENRSTATPGLTVVDQSDPKGSGTDVWHADSTFMKAPPMGAILRAVRVPDCGGDTLWADMAAAYDALEPDLRARLDGLSAEHSAARVMALVERLDNAYARDTRLAPAVVHPVVRVHPETKRKLLFVSPNWVDRIVGLPAAESEALLRFLYEHVKQPEFQCRFRWRPDSIAFWDNRRTQHYAVPDYRERRIMHRVMLAGDVPYGPQPCDASSVPPHESIGRSGPPAISECP